MSPSRINPPSRGRTSRSKHKKAAASSACRLWRRGGKTDPVCRGLLNGTVKCRLAVRLPDIRSWRPAGSHWPEGDGGFVLLFPRARGKWPEGSMGVHGRPAMRTVETFTSKTSANTPSVSLRSTPPPQAGEHHGAAPMSASRKLHSVM